MGLLRFLGVLSPAYTIVFTMTSRGKNIGVDQFGNKYYEAPARKGYKRPRRWVIYKGVPEASSIPPEWHGWIHHQTNTIPSEGEASFRRPWQKGHQPNLTGTTAAYRPPGHILQGGKREKATGDYKPWTPPQ
jgi:NADH:ubiquinone oxidoreductase subunit